MSNILGMTDLDHDKDIIFQKVLQDNFSQKEINDIQILLYKEELEKSEIETIEFFFLRLKNITGSLFDSIVEFCKCYDVDINNIKYSLKKTSLVNQIKQNRSKINNRAFINLFL